MAVLSNIAPGDVLHTATMDQTVWDEHRKLDCKFSFAAPRDKAFVFLFLGAVPRGEELDEAEFEKRMNALGYVKAP